MALSLTERAHTLVAPSKGILAADESPSTMQKRLASINVPQTPENGYRFRDLLFTTPNIGTYLSGVILHDDTIHQQATTGVPFAQLLLEQGILPGIKVDLGLAPLANFPDEEVSRGLDTLDTRLKEYVSLGAQFTKWRSVIRITDMLPSDAALHANAHVLAEYAAIVQSHGLVPMVEPEVLFDGTHTLLRSQEVLTTTLSVLFEALALYRVDISALILKTSMALPGKESGIPLDPPAIAQATVAAFHASVPHGVAGIVFLSGGQTPDLATQTLNHIGMLGTQPWPITFSYSRALEEPVLQAWQGDDANRQTAQDMLVQRLTYTVAARNGTYTAE